MPFLLPMDEVRLPSDLSLGSSLGPEFSTEIPPSASGFEQRSARWQFGRMRGDLRYSVKTLAQLRTLYAFFLARHGMAQAFRVKDHQDYQAVFEGLDVSDGVTTVFQLIKSYGVGDGYDVRLIRKPVGIDFPLGNPYDSVKLYADATLLSGWVLDYSTGLVTLADPVTAGAVVSWSGEFDVPMRFGSDYFPLALTQFGIGQAEPFPVVEWYPEEIAVLAPA